jgi:hypothetical protein
MLGTFKPGTLSADGIVCDHALPMYGDGEYRIPPRRSIVAPVDLDVVIEDEAPSVDTVDMAVAFPGWNRLRGL